MAIWVFSLSLLVILYTYVGYPVLMYLLSFLFKPSVKRGDALPWVTVVIPVHNQEKLIGAKLENCLGFDYPRERLKIIVVSDGSTDRTDEVAGRIQDDRVQLLTLSFRGGKVAAQNHGVRFCDSEIVIFTDVAVLTAPDCVKLIVQNFHDQSVGVVSCQNAASGVGNGLNLNSLFFRPDALLGRHSSQVSSLIEITEGFYGVRTAIARGGWNPAFPPGLYVAMRCIKRGLRVIEDPTIKILQRNVVEEEHELTRDLMNTTGEMYALFSVSNRSLLNPFRFGIISLKLVSEKLLRWMAPFLLVSLLFSNVAMLGESPVFLLILLAQLGICSWVFLGRLARRERREPVEFPSLLSPSSTWSTLKDSVFHMQSDSPRTTEFGRRRGDRLRILYICHRFPFPPKRGGKIRPFNVIAHLSQKHDVTVASIARSKREAHEGYGIQEYCSHYIMDIITRPKAIGNIMTNVPTQKPFSMGFFYSSSLHGLIRKELDHTCFDLIFVHCSSVAQYVEDVTGIPKILDFGDMDSQKWLIYGKVRQFPLNILYHTEGVRLRRAETILAGKFDYSTCTTLAEMETLNSYNVGTKTGWFPNGVDSNYFKPLNNNYDADTICFIGRMDYYPNQECMFDFCRNTLPLIKAERPNVKMFIIGANPSLAVRKLAKIPGVTVTGSVPDVRPYVTRCAVNVAPLNIARGTQNKILESLAMGVPTVASIHAAAGVDAVPGEHLLVASSPEEYTEALLRLLTSRQERRRFSEAGRSRMLSHHSWKGSMEKLDKIIDECLTTRTR